MHADNSYPYSDRITARWTYTRFHKDSRHEHTVYTPAQLDAAADRIRARFDRGVDQYMFFMNDLEAAGPANAQSLMAAVAVRLGPAPLVAGWTQARTARMAGPGSLAQFLARAPAPRAVVEDELSHTDSAMDTGDGDHRGDGGDGDAGEAASGHAAADDVEPVLRATANSADEPTAKRAVRAIMEPL